MTLPLVSLPCTSCGGVAAVLRSPELAPDLRAILAPLVKLASLKFGERLELPKSGNLFELVAPATLSEALEVRCSTCADNLLSVGALVVTDGHA